MESLLAQTAVVVVPQRRIFDESAAMVTERTGLPLGAALPVIQALRAAVGDHAARNAEACWADRAGLTRTSIERTVVKAAGLVDRESLMTAMANGSCEAIDWDTPLTGSAFYSGAATQPGHVVAGLVMPRLAPTDEVLAGLSSGKAVLVAGPSGIGKSAVAWLAAYVARHVVWYRVHRLREADVDPLMRLADAAGAGRYGPVGFVVDGVGTGSLSAWDEFQRRAAGTDGILLLGTVREEDTLPLATFAECVVVRPRMDEDLAARIHAALVADGLTGQPHWREAYERCDGLTLEFAHLLSLGRRLRDVVGEQVLARVRDKRDVELAVIAPVSVAHRWGAGLSLSAVGALAGASDSELKAALTRLADEHLVAVDSGAVRGLHPLRSAALCDAVHDVPPPVLAGTVRRVAAHVEPDELAAFTARAIADRPALAVSVADALEDRVIGAPAHLGTTAAALAGLRLADFTATARRWVAVLEQHAVPVPLRPLAIDLGMIDSELPDAFDPRLLAAVEQIRFVRAASGSPLRDRLADAVGESSVSALVHAAADLHDAASLLAPLLPPASSSTRQEAKTASSAGSCRTTRGFSAPTSSTTATTRSYADASCTSRTGTTATPNGASRT